MSELTEQRLYATRDEYERLLDSVVWHDLVREVDTWLQEIHGRLEHAADMNELKYCQGVAEACRYFIGLPQSIIEALEVQRNV